MTYIFLAIFSGSSLARGNKKKKRKYGNENTSICRGKTPIGLDAGGKSYLTPRSGLEPRDQKAVDGVFGWIPYTVSGSYLYTTYVQDNTGYIQDIHLNRSHVSLFRISLGPPSALPLHFPLVFWV
ncbi:hypothetical protein M430DRAFT_258109 [Amorphotheca resinae ATCC 22711]|jgi:hypothetical protein|uniref:Uncharacterized protein n=1 Tax=Amorphotheca resinae ATCC 22711 TaxID=857342 RepID=A0A2T3AYS4_AMORE|nr:hypothetical protein M430DRAFT_258109 [Amorphotheca resinae ATCC 22711]PSS15214.1 hypothetical protein M430DRAFT_258109 [Amorphotheca resinae ATCC 22711]